MAQQTLSQFIASLAQPEQLKFEQTMAVIEANYVYTPSAFTNGAQNNAEGENAGSCKVFAFGILHQLNEQQTLNLFGQHYRDVVATPEGNDHQNIRQFMLNGWDGVKFSSDALALKGA
ncbi:HopJ type III effector protein [Shewanella sp. TC10]|uniref:HopJ type III effector protein n=1 Tax=Shewanella sp. TC10 TaxID=1419739 RepID=UPI00129D3BAF|nr:HopJ type III effector protein [Shewanella sp. TC10]